MSSGEGMQKETLLITGGTGSLGQAIVKQSLNRGIKEIRIYSRGEHLQWQMQSQFNDDRLKFLIGDIRDRGCLYRALSGVDCVIHCAALKHITACQHNPMEAFKTNLLGSMNLVDVAMECQVKKVLAVSSDKAVAPISVYGATKLGMEYLFKNVNVYSTTKFSTLRSGNFLESRGNVFELWAQQAATGTITLTSKKMRRYFIHIEKVANLALKLLGIMQGQEVFIPKMTEYQLYALLKELYPQAQINVIGKRDGEKLKEELFAVDEHPVDMGDYWVIR